LAALLLAGGCNAITDFNKFKLGDGGAACNLACNNQHNKLTSSCGRDIDCPCVDEDKVRQVPAHCIPTPSNSVPGCSDNAGDATLMGGMYVIDTDMLTFVGTGVNLRGAMAGEWAQFCVRSVFTSARSTIQVNGPRALAIVARDVFQLDGSINLAGDGSMGNLIGAPHGGGGRGGGVGQPGAPAGGTASGGKSGGSSSSPGVGGGGGGNLTFGGVAGGVMGVPATTIMNAGMPYAGVGQPGGGGGGGTASNGGPGGPGGTGGGQLQITAGAFIEIAGQINATGGFGAPGAQGGVDGTNNGGGGGGGGAGGLLFFESPRVDFMEPASGGGPRCISVLGGAGGMGGGATMAGTPAIPRTMCPFGSTPPIGVASLGGAGGDPDQAPYAGKPGMVRGGSGGGAGSPGKVMVRADSAPPSNGISPMTSLVMVGPYTPP
jgi:hypothetical protein